MKRRLRMTLSDVRRKLLPTEKGQAMVDLAARHGSALLTASTWEYTESVGDLRAKAVDMPDIKELTDKIIEFRNKRNWKQFHHWRT